MLSNTTTRRGRKRYPHRLQCSCWSPGCGSDGCPVGLILALRRCWSHEEGVSDGQEWPTLIDLHFGRHRCAMPPPGGYRRQLCRASRVVGDGQVLCSCRLLFCDQKTAGNYTRRRSPRVTLRLAQLSNIYHAGLPGIYLPPGLTRRRQVLRSIAGINTAADFHCRLAYAL